MWDVSRGKKAEKRAACDLVGTSHILHQKTQNVVHHETREELKVASSRGPSTAPRVNEDA